MNYVFVIVILLLCGGGYYEYTELEQDQSDRLAADRTQIEQLKSDLDGLSELESRFKGSEPTVHGDFVKLNAQLSAMQVKIRSMQKISDDIQANFVVPNPAKPPPSNSLGTVSTRDGKTYQNCQLLKVYADGIVFSYTDGITKVNFNLLPVGLEQRFGFDPAKELELTPQEVQSLEKLRIQASGSP